jgi:hypothetical protein
MSRPSTWQAIRLLGGIKCASMSKTSLGTPTMATIRPSFAALALLLIAQCAAAQTIYKCTRPDGKVEFTDQPCQNTGSSGKPLDVRPALPADAKAAQEARERAQRDAERARAASAGPAPAPAALNAGTPTAAPSTAGAKPAAAAIPDDQTLIAQCEAARGVDCRDPKTLQRLREEATPKSAEERREERRRLDEEEARRKSNPR